MSAVMKSKYTFKVVPINPKEAITVIEFLLQFFIRDEPLNAAVQLIKEECIVENFKNRINGLFDNGELKKV